MREPILEVVNEMCSSPMTISNSCKVMRGGLEVLPSLNTHLKPLKHPLQVVFSPECIKQQICSKCLPSAQDVSCLSGGPVCPAGSRPRTSSSTYTSAPALEPPAPLCWWPTLPSSVLDQQRPKKSEEGMAPWTHLQPPPAPTNTPVCQLCREEATGHHLPWWSHCHQWFSSALPSHFCGRMPGRNKTSSHSHFGDALKSCSFNNDVQQSTNPGHSINIKLGLKWCTVLKKNRLNCFVEKSTN